MSRGSWGTASPWRSPSVQSLLAEPALPQNGQEGVGIAGGEGIAVLIEAHDQVVHGGEEQVVIFEEQLGPHGLVEASDAGHIKEAAGGEDKQISIESLMAPKPENEEGEENDGDA